MFLSNIVHLLNVIAIKNFNENFNSMCVDHISRKMFSKISGSVQQPKTGKECRDIRSEFRSVIDYDNTCYVNSSLS